MNSSNPGHRKLGRTARTFNPGIPHLSALLAGQTLPPPPAAANYTTGMLARFGMMLNDSLGDCTCAAFYHALQVWSFKAQKSELTEPDRDVEALYVQACGYDPKRGGEGPGGNEQHVLEFLLKQGAPTGPQGQTRHKILAFLEVDPRNLDDVRRTIYECGVAYIGFNVPQNIMPEGAEPPAVWTVDPSNSKIVGGHAVALPGYDQEGAIVISWGQLYKMTWAFFSTFVDEVYAIADSAWIGAGGKTPAGMTLAQLEAQMRFLRGSSAAAHA
jgi:hypothetical protein